MVSKNQKTNQLTNWHPQKHHLFKKLLFTVPTTENTLELSKKPSKPFYSATLTTSAGPGKSNILYISLGTKKMTQISIQSYNTMKENQNVSAEKNTPTTLQKNKVTKTVTQYSKMN